MKDYFAKAMRVAMAICLAFSMTPSVAFADETPVSSGAEGTMSGDDPPASVQEDGIEAAEGGETEEADASEASAPAATAETLSAAGTQDQGGISLMASASDYTFSGGSGTETDPYLISTAQDLWDLASYTALGTLPNGMNYTYNKYFKMTNDIDVGASEEHQWVPIGGSRNSAGYFFSGTFDGDYHVISGVYINTSAGGTQMYGLFGGVSYGTLKHFVVRGEIRANNYPAGVVSELINTSTVDSVGNEATVAYAGSGNYAAGIVSQVQSGQYVVIKNCWNAGTIGDTNSATAAGIVGYASNRGAPLIQNCYNVGTIVTRTTGNNNHSGGIICDYANSYESRVIVENCYNAGSVTSGYALTDNTLNSKQVKGFYYNSSVCEKAAKPSSNSTIEATAMSTADMMSSDFAAALGDAFVARAGSYPMLKAQLPYLKDPVIVTQPEDAEIAQGDAAETLSVYAQTPVGGAGEAGTLSYQWYECDDAQGNGARAVAGEEYSTFTPAVAGVAGNYFYFCEVTNTFTRDGAVQEGKATTRVAAYTVTDNVPCAVPTILAQPLSFDTVYAAQGAQLAIAAEVSGTGAGKLTYQWFSAADEQGADAQAIEGEVGTALNVDTAVTGTGYYFCEVTNTFPGTTKSETVRTDVATVSVADVVEITTAEELLTLSRNVNSGSYQYAGVTVKLANDIDLSSVCGAEKGNWEPIGQNKAGYEFFGDFDGGYHTVSGLYYSDDAGEYAGLIGYAESCTIKNLVVEGFVHAKSYVGGIVGCAAGVVLENLYNKATVEFANTSAAGVIGRLSAVEERPSSLTGCVNAGSISCFATSGQANYVGGIVGIVNIGGSEQVPLTNCYNLGAINTGERGTAYIGGLIGHANSIVLTNCYNAGSVTTADASGDVFVARCSTSDFANCYYVADSVEGASNKCDVSVISVADAKAAAFAAGLGDAYQAVAGAYPQLKWETAAAGGPLIVNQPQGATYKVNDAAEALSVTVEVPCAEAALSYQWYVATSASLADGVAIENATAATYTPSTAQAGAFYYYCVVTNKVGDASYTAQSAAVLVAVTSDIAAATPVITQQPAGEDVAFGGTPQALTVAASVEGAGAGVLSYQWFAADNADFEGAEAVSGATDATLAPSVVAGTTKYFRCEVTNTFEGMKTAVATSDVAKVYVSNVKEIATAEEFVAFGQDVLAGNDYAGIEIRLVNDIDLTNALPEGGWDATTGDFCGTLNGAYHTVSGFYSTKSGLLYALCKGAVIENLTLKGSIDAPVVSATRYFGIIASQTVSYRGTGSMPVVRNVGVEVDANLVLNYSSSPEIAGIVAHDTGSTATDMLCIENCYNKGNITVSIGSEYPTSLYMGGIFAQGPYGPYVQVKNCYNTGNISYTGTGAASLYMGGISGYRTAVTNCYNTGSVTSAQRSGTTYGVTQSNQSTVVNSYYLAGCASATSGIGGTSATADTMRSASFAAGLGDAYLAVDGAYPRLAWEGNLTSIVKQPESALYAKDAEASALTVEVAKPEAPNKGYDGELTYQWYVASGNVADPAADHKVDDATSASFTPSTAQAGEASYYCVVTNTYGDAQETLVSALAKITVIDGAAAGVTVTSQPEGGAYAQLGEAELEVAAAFGEGVQGTLAYQWYKADSVDGEGVAVAGADQSAYVTRDRELGEHYYYCVVSNVVGGVAVTSAESARAKVTVSPIEVATAADLAELSALSQEGETFVGCDIVLTQDIDLSEVCGPTLGSWTPINYVANTSDVSGKSESQVAKRLEVAFRGHFDGQGHTISNLYINSKGQAALFGTTHEALIENFVLTGSVTTTANYSAGVVAMGFSGTTVRNVGNECDVTAGSGAGIIGAMGGAGVTVENCYNTGDISGSGNTVAGIAVKSWSSEEKISNCYNVGDITSKSSLHAMGIGDAATLENCYNLGAITATAMETRAMGISSSNPSGMCYSVATTGEALDNVETITVAEADSDEFAAKLGADFVRGTSYPLLAWQVDEGHAVITGQPADASYVQGERAFALNVTAALPEGTGANGALSYQWFEAGKADLSDAAAIEGATDASYAFKTANLSAGTHYFYCEVTNTFDGKAASIKSRCARIDVTSTTDAKFPQFTLQPSSAYYATDEAYTVRDLAVELAATEGIGYGQISYQWYKAFSSASAGLPIAGATGATYTPEVTGTGTSYYYCLVTNTFEGVKIAQSKSDVARIVAYSAASASPVLTDQPAGTVRYTQGDEAAELSVAASLPDSMPGSSGKLAYQWYRNTTGTANPSADVKISGAQKSTYAPDTSLAPDVYYYYCVVTNNYYADSARAAEAVTSAARVELVSATEAKQPAITFEGETSFNYDQASKASAITAKVECAGDGVGELTYQWYRGTSPQITADDEAIAGESGTVPEDGVVTIVPSTAKKAGTWYYYLVVTNTFEKVKTAAGASAMADVTLNPYLYIYTLEDFLAFRDAVNAGTTYAGLSIELMCDIDLQGSEDNQWTPIGNSRSFGGFFNGNGHTISGLYINRTESTNWNNGYIGLFGNIGTFSGDSGVSNLVVKGSITYNCSYQNVDLSIGGIAGYASFATFENVGSEVDLDITHYPVRRSSGAWDSVGGIVGAVNNMHGIYNCYNTGNIAMSDVFYQNYRALGGIIGNSKYNGNLPIVNCYNTGNVTNAGFGGGIIGYAGTYTQLSNCFSTGTVTQRAGNFASYYSSLYGITNGNNPAVSNLYYLEGTCKVDTVAGAPADSITKVSQAQMKNADFVSSLNGQDGTAFVANTGSYPVLAWQNNVVVNAPLFTQQPEDGTYAGLGTQAGALSVDTTVTGAYVGEVTYQWYKNTVASTAGGQAIEGQTGASFVPPTTDLGRVFYYCVATHTFGDVAISAPSNVVWFETTPTAIPAAAPTFPTQPQGATYEFNQADAAALTVVPFAEGVPGVGEVTYQWYKNSEPSVEGAVAIADATQASYTPSTAAGGDTYYFCKVTNVFENVKVAEGVSAFAKVTIPNSIEVATAQQLKDIASKVNGGTSLEGFVVKLTSDIDLSTVCGETLGSWPGIGVDGKMFQGTFDGQGHTVSGLYVNDANANYIGLFGFVQGATIKNVTVQGSVSAKGYAGGVVGRANTGTTIQNVRNEASVTGSSNYVGGVVGYIRANAAGSDPVTVSNCANAGAVSCVSYAGGVVGYIYGGAVIDSCYNTASVVASTDYTGGIVSYVYARGGDVHLSSCFNAGAVKAASHTGGVAGYSRVWTGQALEASNNYYLEGSSATDQVSAVAKSAADMKAESFASLLNGSGSAYVAVDGSFPRLAWEMGTSIATCSIDPVADQVYTGSAIEPAVTVKAGDTVLELGTDYTLSYENNVNTGVATVVVKGMGSYYGTITANFTITGTSIAAAQVSGVEDSYVFAGAPVVPSVTVTMGEDGAAKTLALGVDYTVSVSGNAAVGTATLVISGMGAYDGTITKTFQIAAGNIALATASSIDVQTWTGNEVKPAFTLTMGEGEAAVALSEYVDYLVTYANNVDEGTATITVEGIGNFAGSSKTIEFSISRIDISAAEVSGIAEGGYPYTGAAVCPVPTVKLGGKTLVYGVDFTVDYANNIAVSDTAPTLTVKAAENSSYKGSVAPVPFKINQADISQVATFSEIPAQTWTGSALTPEVKVYVDGVELAAGSYELEYSDNVEVGTGKVAVSAKGDLGFTGTKELTFSIVPRDFSDAAQVTSVSLENDVYTGSAVVPGSVAVSLGDAALVENTDYTWTVSNNVNAGQATVMVTGAGHYQGTITGTFAIKQASLEGAQVEAASQTYNGSAFEPAVSVTFNGVTVPAEVFATAFANNVNAGTASVEVTALEGGNFVAGTKAQGTFQIAKATQAAPAGIARANESVAGLADGALYNVDDTMEWSLAGSDAWTPVAAGANRVTGLTAGVYEVRYAADANHLAGDSARFGIAANAAAVYKLSLADEAASGIDLGGLTFGYTEAPSVAAAVTNAGNMAQTGVKATVSGEGAAAFAVSVSADSLGKGEAATVSVAAVSGLSVGTYKAVVTVASNEVPEGVSFPVSVAVSAADLSQAVVSAPAQTYAASALEPEVSVSVAGQTLVAGTDFTVTSYANNLYAGEATVSVEGMGNWTGAASGTFVIERAPLTVTADSFAKEFGAADPELTYTVSGLAGSDKVEGVRVMRAAGEEASANYAIVAFGGRVLDAQGKDVTSCYDIAYVDGALAVGDAIADTPWDRLAGYDLYDTNQLIVQDGFQKGETDTVILATGSNFPDALAASALAGIYSAPVLLTTTDELSSTARAEIERLAPSTVYIVGGRAVVSPEVEAEVEGLGVETIKRLAGNAFTDTALEVYKEGVGNWGNTALVASGNGYADALSGSSWAYAERYPIFLTDEGVLDDAAVKAINEGGFDRVIILGGKAVVKESVESAFADGIAVSRLAGLSAYETSAEVANFAAADSNAIDYDGLIVATGDGFADALGAGALAGKRGTIVLLASEGVEGSYCATNVVAKNAWRIGTGTFVGGKVALPESVATLFEQASKG